MKYISVAVDGQEQVKAPFQRLLPKVLAIHT